MQYIRFYQNRVIMKKLLGDLTERGRRIAYVILQLWLPLYGNIAAMLVVQGWVLATATPVAMVQHATSSQSFVIHEPYAASGSSANLANGPSPIGQPGGNQPKYEYKYEVSDQQTGDRKSHWETREGDRVRGVYTLYEPDGALRRVEYSADAVHGFNAIVTRDGQTKHHPPTPQPPFVGPSPCHNSYESSSRLYIPDRGAPAVTSGYSDRSVYQGSSDGGVGYNVNHGALKSNEVFPKPY